MTDHILATAKAYAALIGAVLTAVIATSTDLPDWVSVVAAVCTAVATYAIPNREAQTKLQRDERGAADVGLIILIAILLIVALWWFGVRP